jgi:Transcriptional regulator PadR-like family
MEDRLRNLKKAMKRTVLQDFSFTENHKSSIRRQINQPSISEEGVLVSIFQLLKVKQTGFELNRLLRARGIEKFESEEGFLYMSLHRLEHKGYLHTQWVEPDIKYYQLNAKGLKMLKNLENEGNNEAYFLNEILER